MLCIYKYVKVGIWNDEMICTCWYCFYGCLSSLESSECSNWILGFSVLVGLVEEDGMIISSLSSSLSCSSLVSDASSLRLASNTPKPRFWKEREMPCQPSNPSNLSSLYLTISMYWPSCSSSTFSISNSDGSLLSSSLLAVWSCGKNAWTRDNTRIVMWINRIHH